MLAEKLKSQGVLLAVNGDKLTVETMAPLTDEQRTFIRSHKEQLIVELRAMIPHCVKCINCRHFVRSDHPHLGKCEAGALQTAPAGFWDTHLRGCSKFIEITGERK